MKIKVTAKLVNLGKKNKFYKGISLVLLTMYLLFYYVGEYCKANVRRFTAIVCLAVIFMGSTSFAFIDEKALAPVGDLEPLRSDDITEQLVPVRKEKKTELLEDKDVMEGYENHDIEYVKEEERFSVDEILDENQHFVHTQSKAKGEADASISANETAGYKPDKDDWRLVLINKHHSIPDDYTFTLGTIRGSMQCDERIIPDLYEMLKAAKTDGVNLAICSPYRDLNRQKVLFNRKIKAYMKQGKSYLEAYYITSQTVTVPGASEHQIGLAIDFISNTYTSLNEGFGETDAGKWLAAHSYEYGFILRYPKEKEYITGIEYEPWHFRYVGKEAATIMSEQGITLEEFVEDL